MGLVLGLVLIWQFWQVNRPYLYQYFFIYPTTKDAIAAFHVYAVEMGKEINQEEDSDVAFVLPRNTAAGDVNQNFTVDFLTAVKQPPAAHYWLIDDERTLPEDLTRIARRS